MSEELIIFGAGSGAVKVIKTLRSIGTKISALADNDKRKWGTLVEGLTVISPDTLGERACKILIASDYQEEIEKQLLEMGILDRLVLREEYILDYIRGHIDEFNTEKVSSDGSSGRVIIDQLESIAYGGIEVWSYLVAEGLAGKGKKILFLGDPEELFSPAKFRESFRNVPVIYESYRECLKRLTALILRQLPCTLIVNRQGIALMAAAAVKMLYPEKLKCISIMHTDKQALYRRHGFMHPYIDLIAGVSTDINKRLVEEYGVPREKIRFKESPVICSPVLNRSYTLDKKEPVVLGYGGRIAKTQKRVDLLLKLIGLLEERGIHYRMKIAGAGAYESRLKDFIREKNLDGRVQFLGKLEKDSMPEFWKSSDIFINVSDYEGTSLSMLEAMAQGAAPVVTRVSGTGDVIRDGGNGCVVELRDMEGAAERIAALADDREKMAAMGEAAGRTIREKCRLDDYISYIEGMCLREQEETAECG